MKCMYDSLITHNSHRNSCETRLTQCAPEVRYGDIKMDELRCFSSIIFYKSFQLLYNQLHVNTINNTDYLALETQIIP